MRYYITYLDDDGKEILSSKRFNSQNDAEIYADTIATDREPKILTTYPHFETLADIKNYISELKMDILFKGTELEDTDNLPPMSAEFFLLALNDLDNAVRHIKLAEYNRMQNR